MKGCMLVFALLLASAAASYWRDELKSVKSMYSLWSRAQQNSDFDCKTVVWNSQTLDSGVKIERQWVHICPTQNGVCFTSTVRRCCKYTGLEGVIADKTGTVGSQSINVKVLYVGDANVCAYYGSINDGISSCPAGGGRCSKGQCQIAPQICTNNSAGSCDPSGCRNCKVGYVEPSCCECEENYERAPDGSCQFVCKANCNGPNGDCSFCAHPYTNAPFCCDCLSPFVKKSDGTCGCPEGQIEIDGTCKAVCTGNTVSCGSFPCSCKTGFKSPLCCECVFNLEGSGDSYFESDGQCKQICKGNALKAYCSVDSGCSQCEDSFNPPDCCECKEPMHLIDGVCRLCLDGQVVVGGKCKNICTKNIVAGSCTKTSCHCLSGYTGSDCCDCASDYILDGEVCRRCPPGQVPDSTQSSCICDPSNGKQVYVDGKCKSICEDYALECTESSCSCKPLFAPPDCCKCTNGDEPKDGVCSVPCIDDQNIIFAMDRSVGIGQTELWGAMYVIEILTSALLKGTKDLVIDVVSYATSHEGTSLINLTPKLFTGKEVTPLFCTNTLKKYERNIRNVKEFPRPVHTYSGHTLQLLKDIVRKGTKTTVITFAGTLSNDPPQNLVEIENAIKEMKAEVGSSNVQFFGAGFEAENLLEGEGTRREQYFGEVKALGYGKSTHNVVNSIHNNAAGLLKNVTDMLYNNGILCGHQRDMIYAGGSESTINSLFYDYEKCVVTTTTPCITIPKYNFVCLNDTVAAAREMQETEASLLTAMKELLDKLIN